MDIFLDNIIFSLQRVGGASVVWKQHLDRLIKDKEFDCNFLEYDNAKLNFFRQQLSLNNEQIDLKNPSLLEAIEKVDLIGKTIANIFRKK